MKHVRHSGVVYGGSSPLANATVEALTNGTTTAVATSVTNSSGQYSLDVSPARYDLRVTPPAGSGFGQEIVQDVEVTALGNRTSDTGGKFSLDSTASSIHIYDLGSN